MDVNNVFEESPSVYSGSRESIRSELNSFSLPPTDISTKFSVDYVDFFPLSSFRDSLSPLEFVINFEGNGYMDFSDSCLLLKFRVLQCNGEKVPEEEEVAPDLAFFHSMFSNLEIYINSQLVFDANNYYPFMAVIQRMCSASPLEKDGRYRQEFWYENTVQDTFTSSADQGFKTRFEKTKNSQQYAICGTFAANMFNQSRWLPPGNTVRLILRRSHPQFCLTSATTEKEGVVGSPYVVQLDEAIFCAARRIVTPKITELHRKLLASGKTYKFYTNEIELKSFVVPRGMSNANSDALVLGKIPKIIVLSMVSNQAFNGVLNKSPFNFQSFGLSDVTFTWSGETVEHRILQFSYKSSTGGCENFLQALRALSNTASSKFLGNGIHVDNFLNGKVDQNFMHKSSN